MHHGHTKEANNVTRAGWHSGAEISTKGLPLVAIIGNPNVGKSVLFNALTGSYVTVSNYPGTTVGVSRGKGRIDGQEIAVVDTPGMYGLMPITAEERVARHIVFHERPEVIIHVVDAKNLERMLPMTLQLLEAGLPVILTVNFIDEAEHLGIQIDIPALERQLGIAVVPTALVLGRGTAQLKKRIAAQLAGRGAPQGGASPRVFIQYTPVVEDHLRQIEAQLNGKYVLNRRTMAWLFLHEDDEILAMVRQQENRPVDALLAIRETLRKRFSQPMAYLLMQQQLEVVRGIINRIMTIPETKPAGFATRLSEAMMNPLSGIPLLLLSLFLLYEFVGVLGAQTMVNFLEQSVFGAHINPWVNGVLEVLIPWAVIRDLFGGQYGIITLGVRYAVAIILPIVGTFFLAFSVIEDSGYLPRLAMLIDRVFKNIGLNGRAVIPMVLGFGCDTMATIVTRTLETRRERILSTLLLALAVPCSAQLGVMLGLLAGRLDLLILWGAIVTGVFLLVGFLAAQVIPGERPTFFMELPPLRVPKLSNVLMKTYTHMEWYFREVFPLFILASVLIWLGQLTGVFHIAVQGLEPLVRMLGLPDATAVAFLFGFFRRDYGAAGLFDLRHALSGTQLLVATVTMTLFVPCIAQFSVMLKERGWKMALAIDAFIFPFAFLVGALLNWLSGVLGAAL